MVEVCEVLSGEEDSYEEGSNDDYGAPLEEELNDGDVRFMD